MKLTSLFRNLFRLIESALEEDAPVAEVGDVAGNNVVGNAVERAVGIAVGIAVETETAIAPPPTPTVATPWGKREQVGEAFSTVLTGNAGEDALFSGEGRFSSLYGGGGDDYLQGNGGNDWLYGEGGNDTLLGGSGIDYLYGGSGDDFLDGGSGDDWLTGGFGADVFVLRPGDGTKLIWDFQTGVDSFGLDGGLGAMDVEAIPAVLGSSILRVVSTQEVLATLVGVDASEIGRGDFVVI